MIMMRVVLGNEEKGLLVQPSIPLKVINMNEYEKCLSSADCSTLKDILEASNATYDPGRRRKRNAFLTTVQPPLVDVFLNPVRQTEKRLVEEYMVNITRNLFYPPLPPSSFPHLFRLLRQTSLPCLPSGQNSAHMLLKCMWAGEEFDCGKIFTPVPTDSGMCCAFNPRSIIR